MLKNLLLLLLPGLAALLPHTVFSQPCTPQGDVSVYGTNNVWIGYVYKNYDLTDYLGYVNEGSTVSPNFYQDFSGATVNYPTNGCSVYTERFGVRYRLTKSFSPGTYDFTVAGDDGYRLSLDGGATWIIDNWSYLGFAYNTATVTLNGVYNMVLEYYDYAHNNRIAFQVSNACFGTENTTVYGTNNVWRGYVYNGTNFDFYKGLRNQGTTTSADFDENFGGSYIRFNTNSCGLLSENFSVRYRLSKTFSANHYSIIVGSEDGYRLSLDGGASWVIDNWSNTSYTSSTLMTNLSGAYDMVLEYKETTGANRINFSAGLAVTLPVNFKSFTARNTGSGVALQWELGEPAEAKYFEIEKSKDGRLYQATGVTDADDNTARYFFSDQSVLQNDTYYRIKAVTRTGEIFYSRSVIVSDSRKGIRLFPTSVVNSTLYIANESTLTNANLIIADLTGKTVANYKLNNISSRQTTSIYLPSDLAKGLYVAKLQDAGGVVLTEKIFIQ